MVALALVWLMCELFSRYFGLSVSLYLEGHERLQLLGDEVRGLRQAAALNTSFPYICVNKSTERKCSLERNKGLTHYLPYIDEIH
jgi:hypothetical protein